MLPKLSPAALEAICLVPVNKAHYDMNEPAVPTSIDVNGRLLRALNAYRAAYCEWISNPENKKLEVALNNAANSVACSLSVAVNAASDKT